MIKVGFGGGCHWCTEAVFQSLKGVGKVEQGWIAPQGDQKNYSEAVLVHFDTSLINLKTLVSIHLYTHSCTSNHTMRAKYRSAVYTFTKVQFTDVQRTIKELQREFEQPIVTQALPFYAFKENKELYQNYYLKNSKNQFCETYINPKLRILMKRFSKQLDEERIGHISPIH